MTLRALIVDDDRDHAESVADVLDIRGYAVELAYSGEEGAERFRQADYDIVLMDVKLPGMNGVETFFEFRKIRPDAKVLMMTGYSVEELVAQAVENGALGVLYKPFAIERLLDVLDRVKPRGMVLVADDDPDFAGSIVPLLQQSGYRVDIACDGPAALEKAQCGGIDCLILDMRLPLLSGLEVYMRLKEAAWAVPTIFVTGFAEESGALDAVAPFTRGLLIKPFDPAQLLGMIEAALARKDAVREPAD